MLSRLELKAGRLILYPPHPPETKVPSVRRILPFRDEKIDPARTAVPGTVASKQAITTCQDVFELYPESSRLRFWLFFVLNGWIGVVSHEFSGHSYYFLGLAFRTFST
jgi:hypothetical protein